MAMNKTREKSFAAKNISDYHIVLYPYLKPNSTINLQFINALIVP